MIRLGEKLHNRVLDAVMNHLHEMPRAIGTHVRDARSARPVFRGHFLQERQERLRQLADNGIRHIREEQELESKQAELFGLNVPQQSWRKEIADAESYWLSPVALQRCVESYLSTRLDATSEHLLGEKTIKTLRLNQEARMKLLADYRELPRIVEPIARDWEKWLKGAQPTLTVTFDQPTAADAPKTVHLSVMHPLVRQAARCQQRNELATVVLRVPSATVPPGLYTFALYRWQKHGVRADEALVPVASDERVEPAILQLLQTAMDVERGTMPSRADRDALEEKHHAKWTVAQANHISDNRQQVEHRIHSLKVSHQARCKVLEDQIARASNQKILLMKQSELARAQVTFQRQMEELERAAGGGDIHGAPIVFGTIVVQPEGIMP